MEQKLSRESQLSGLGKATNKILKLREEQQQDRHVIRAQDEEIARLQRELQIVNDALCTKEEDLGLDPVESLEDSLLYALSQAKVDYDNAMLQLRHAEEELQVQRERTEGLEADLQTTEEEAGELRAEVEQLKAELAAEKRRSTQFGSKVTSLEQQLEAIEDENAALSVATRELQATLEQNERSVADVQYESNSQKMMYDELLHRFDRKTAELKDLHDKYDSLQAEHVADIETFATEREDLESILDQLQREVQRAQEDCEAYRARADDARGQISGAQAEADHMRRELADYKAGHGRLERELEEANRKTAQLQAALDQEVSAKDEHATERRRLAETADDTSRKVAMLEAQVRELKEEKDALRTAKSQLQQTLLREIRALRSGQTMPVSGAESSLRTPGVPRRVASTGGINAAVAAYRQQNASTNIPARASMSTCDDEPQPVTSKVADATTRAHNLETLRAMAGRSRAAALQSPEPDQIVEFDGGDTLLEISQ
ncbi:Chromosome partition protein Smc [Carpediemonas membranifera]|uniref:Chromosome partition protein Smc n=1 Tax=Carpediemonas membranifera TaxID=201153 RepID=A0A8J6B0U2_9EUKA|nr:Chromosome partition protein Smc [Carpediemonas membranifera]|eukprot:KAG9390524.1 Chromosome partition protein Smc [Carpediemonas membranifera]